MEKSSCWSGTLPKKPRTAWMDVDHVYNNILKLAHRIRCAIAQGIEPGWPWRAAPIKMSLQVILPADPICCLAADYQEGWRPARVPLRLRPQLSAGWYCQLVLASPRVVLGEAISFPHIVVAHLPLPHFIFSSDFCLEETLIPPGMPDIYVAVELLASFPGFAIVWKNMPTPDNLQFSPWSAQSWPCREILHRGTWGMIFVTSIFCNVFNGP